MSQQPWQSRAPRNAETAPVVDLVCPRPPVRRPGSPGHFRACHDEFMAACTHLDSIERLELPEPVAGCEECLAAGTRWVHLRMCQTCGHVGCCDNSPGRHATAHHEASGHPIIRSAEPGEDWSWCYVDELMFRLRPS